MDKGSTEDPMAYYGDAVEAQARLLKQFRQPHVYRQWFPSDLEEPFNDEEAIRLGLTYGRPYFWDGLICDWMKSAAATLGTNPWYLYREFVPAPQGFFWFERAPSSYITESGIPLHLRGFAWTIFYADVKHVRRLRLPNGMIVEQPVVDLQNPESGGGDMERAVGVKIQFFSQRDDRREIFPAGATTWRWGKNHLELVQMDLDRSGAEPRDLLSMGGMDNAVIVSCWQFLTQHILEASPLQRLDRAAERRIKHEGTVLDPLVSVIRLRRKKYVGYTPPEEDSGRRMGVRSLTGEATGGFWRPFYYPSFGFPVGHSRAYQSRWVLPFWRGPEGAPIKISRVEVGLVDR